jgi:hypothetical protein
MTALRFLAPRAESLALVAILLTVATFAAAASFTHVHDWTMRNSPALSPRYVRHDRLSSHPDGWVTDDVSGGR